jgi:hypothetical protein
MHGRQATCAIDRIYQEHLTKRQSEGRRKGGDDRQR